MPISFAILPADLPVLKAQRYQHPHPRVQQRCGVLWLVGKGWELAAAAELAGVSTVTAWRYGREYRDGGLAAALEERWQGPTGELDGHAQTLAEAFAKEPPRTVAEAAARIEALTGVRRGHTQVRQFLRDRLDMKWRRTAPVPCPPQKTWPSMPASKTSS